MSPPLEAVVVGAGVVGAAAAAALAARGARVVLVDDDRPGRATAAGAGILAPSTSAPAGGDLAAFSAAAVAHHGDLVAQVAAAGLGPTSHRTTGELVVALEDGEVAEVEAAHRRACAAVAASGGRGVGEPQLWDGAAVRARAPQLAPVAAALWLPQVACVDGRVLRERLVELAVARGAEVEAGRASPVLAGGAVEGVEVGDGRGAGGRRRGADVVVLAAGAWTGALLPQELRAAAPRAAAVAAQRGQIVHLSLPGAASLPAVSSRRGHYLLSFPGDRLVVGATRETGEGEPVLTAGGVAQVLAQGADLLPALPAARWLEARVGLRPASADGSPVLGPVVGAAGLWVATGLGPQGLTLGPWAGEVVAAAACGEDADLPASFAPS